MIAPLHTVDGGVFDDGLHNQLGYGKILQFGGHVDAVAEAVAEAHLQNAHVAADVVEILAQGNHHPAALNAVAQQAGKRHHGLVGSLGVDADHEADVFQRIEQEVRMKLAFQLLDLGHGGFMPQVHAAAD